jgi:hypothetical protein
MSALTHPGAARFFDAILSLAFVADETLFARQRISLRFSLLLARHCALITDHWVSTR